MKTPSPLCSDNAQRLPVPSGRITYEHSYAGKKDQVRKVRADLTPIVESCPFSDDLLLMASELCTNAVVHSRSGLPGGVFTVRAEVLPGDYAWLEVEDQGGPWIDQNPDDEHGRGLAMVASLAGEGNWTIEARDSPDTRVAWVLVDWPGES